MILKALAAVAIAAVVCALVVGLIIVAGTITLAVAEWLAPLL